MKLYSIIGALFYLLSGGVGAEEIPGLTPVEMTVDRGRVVASFPIAFPSNPAGIKPEVSISYQLAYSSTVLGRSFRLEGFDEIHRCKSKLEDNRLYDDMPMAMELENSNYCINGNVLIENVGKDSFSTVVNDNAIYEYSGNVDSPEYWLMKIPNGKVAKFKKDASGNRSTPSYNDRWFLSSIRDSNAAAPELTEIKFTYHSSSYAKIPKDITYGDVVVNFNYEKVVEEISKIRQGSFYKDSKRLTAIEIYRDNQLELSHRIIYENIANGLDYRLKGLRSCYPKEPKCTKPSYVNYEDNELYDSYGRNSDVIYEKEANISVDLPNLTGYSAGNIDSDGVIDFCTYSVEGDQTGIVCGSRNSSFTRRNPLSEQIFDLSYIYKYYDKTGLDKSTLELHLRKYSEDVQSLNSLVLIDLNNDGFDDYCYFKDALTCGINNQDGTFGEAYPAIKGYPLAGERQKFSERYLDLNYDGYVDICFAKKEIRNHQSLTTYCRLNDGRGNWSKSSEEKYLENHGISPLVKRPLSALESADGKLIVGGNSVPYKNHLLKLSMTYMDINSDMVVDYCVANRGVNCYLGKIVNGRVSYSKDRKNKIDVYELITGGKFNENGDVLAGYGSYIERALETMTFGDVNNDGTLDICYVYESNPVCHLNNGLGDFEEKVTIEEVVAFELLKSSPELYNKEDASRFYRSFEIKDWNSDGINDICWVNGSFLKCSFGRLLGFSGSESLVPINLSEDVYVGLKSRNKKEKRSTIGYIKNVFKDGPTNKVFFLSQDASISFGPMLKISDSDADGREELCYRSEDGISCVNLARTSLNQIKSVKNSYGAKKIVLYKSTLADGLYSDLNTEVGVISRNPAKNVVSKILTDNGFTNIDNDFTSVGLNEVVFQYSSYIHNPYGQSPGFSKVTEINRGGEVEINRFYSANSRLSGVLIKKETRVNGLLANSVSNNYRLVNSGYGFYKRFLGDKSVLTSDGFDYRTVSSTYSEFDKFNFPGKVVVERQGKSLGDYSKVTKSMVYEHAKGFHTLGLVSEELKTIESGDVSETLKPAIKREYDARARLIKEIKTTHDNNIVNDGFALKLEVEYSEFTNLGKPRIIKTKGASHIENDKWAVSTRVKSREYFENGLLKSEKNSLDQEVAYQYDESGIRCQQPNVIIDTNGRKEFFNYDELCRVSIHKHYDGAMTTTSWQWDDSLNRGIPNTGSLYSSTPSSYKVVTVRKLPSQSLSGDISSGSTKYYDRFGRLLRDIRIGERSGDSCDENSQNIYVDYAYDKFGRQSGTTLPYSSCESELSSINTQIWNSIEYDHFDRIVKTTNPGDFGDKVSEYEYNGDATSETVNGNLERVVSDSIHFHPLRIDKNRSSIFFTRNGLGNTTKVNRDGVVTTIEYDDFGNKIEMSDPDMGVWSYKYNAFGELVEQVDGDGNKSQLFYDSLGRLIKKLSGSDVWVWDYDPDNAVGSLKSLSGSDGIYRSYRYDSLGRLKSNTLKIEELNSELKTSFSYDEANRLVDTIHPTGVIVHRDYDYLGRIARISMPKSEVSGYNFDVMESSIDYMDKAIAMLEKEVSDNLGKAKLAAKEALRLQKHAENLAAIPQIDFDDLENLNKAASSAVKTRDYYERKMNSAQKELDSMRRRGMDHFVAMNEGSPVNLYHKWSYRRKEISGKETGKYSDSGTVKLLDSYTQEGVSVRERSDVSGNQCRIYFKRVVSWRKVGYRKKNECVPAIHPVNYYVHLTNAYRIKFSSNDAQYKSSESQYVAKRTELVDRIDEANTVLGRAKSAYSEWRRNSLEYQAKFDLLIASQNSQAEMKNLIAALDEAQDGYATLWAATRYHADGRLLSEVFGNGFTTEREVYPKSQRIKSISTALGGKTAGRIIRDLYYTYDDIGNILSKNGMHLGTQEVYEYNDPTSTERLTGWTWSQPGNSLLEPIEETYGYDNYGNMTVSSGDSLEFDSVSHRVVSAEDSAGIKSEYAYSGSGNLRSNGKGLSISWNNFNKPDVISSNGSESRFGYDADGKRVFMELKESNEITKTIYANNESELVDDGRTVVWRYHIRAAGDIVATIEKQNQIADKVAFIHRDLQGNPDTVTDIHGNVMALNRIDSDSSYRGSHRLYNPYGKLLGYISSSDSDSVNNDNNITDLDSYRAVMNKVSDLADSIEDISVQASSKYHGLVLEEEIRFDKYSDLKEVSEDIDKYRQSNSNTANLLALGSKSIEGSTEEVCEEVTSYRRPPPSVTIKRVIRHNGFWKRYVYDRCEMVKSGDVLARERLAESKAINKTITGGGKVIAVTNGEGSSTLDGNTVVVSPGLYKQRLQFTPVEKARYQSSIAGGLRGYTGHEPLEAHGLVHMNARIYDPTNGRFLSADTIVPDPNNWDSYNRYMYVRGNPMKYRDPSGHLEVDNDVLNYSIDNTINFAASNPVNTSTVSAATPTGTIEWSNTTVSASTSSISSNSTSTYERKKLNFKSGFSEYFEDHYVFIKHLDDLNGSNGVDAKKRAEVSNAILFRAIRAYANNELFTIDGTVVETRAEVHARLYDLLVDNPTYFMGRQSGNALTTGILSIPFARGRPPVAIPSVLTLGGGLLTTSGLGAGIRIIESGSDYNQIDLITAFGGVANGI